MFGESSLNGNQFFSRSTSCIMTSSLLYWLRIFLDNASIAKVYKYHIDSNIYTIHNSDFESKLNLCFKLGIFLKKLFKKCPSSLSEFVIAYLYRRYVMRVISLLAIAVAGLLLSGCAGTNPYPNYYSQYSSYYAARQNQQRVTAAPTSHYAGSYGSTTQKIGNFYYHSDGSITQRIGNFYYNSDGTTIQKIGNMYYT